AGAAHSALFSNTLFVLANTLAGTPHMTIVTVLRRSLGAVLAIGLCVSVLPAAAYQLDNWPSVAKQGRGQTVYWAAWAGDSRTNAYINWVGKQMAARYDIDVVHVKVSDTAQAVARVLAEKA